MQRCTECHKTVPEEGGGFVTRVSDLYVQGSGLHFVCERCLRKAEGALSRAVHFVIYFMLFLSLLYVLFGEAGLLR